MNKALEAFDLLTSSYVDLTERERSGYIGIVETEFKRLEKQDEILRIIKEKKVDMFALIHMDTVEHYNNLIHCENEYRKLTQEEYDLLKEVLM